MERLFNPVKVMQAFTAHLIPNMTGIGTPGLWAGCFIFIT